MNKRPYVLTIAGFDPSGGAGILADIKTFEANKVNGLAVATSITYQTEDTFEKADWLSKEQIIAQATILLKKYKVGYCKIGLIENTDILLTVINELKKISPTINIIWDPILVSSSGFVIHKKIEKEKLNELLKSIFLITPNWNEAETLSGQEAIKGCETISKHCSVYLKGGHNKSDGGKDYLFHKENIYPFRKKREAPYSKHGSGCVLSAALTSNLARSFPMIKACLRSKEYTTHFLNSNKTLLGYHKV